MGKATVFVLLRQDKIVSSAKTLESKKGDGSIFSAKKMIVLPTPHKIEPSPFPRYPPTTIK
jgi:hypothetical protein